MSKYVDWGMIHGEGEIVCECDGCGYEERIWFDTGYPDYKEAQKELRSMGWLSKKVDGEWMDFCCSECSETVNRKFKTRRSNYVDQN